MPSSQKVDEYLAELPDWQREFLGTFRKLIHNVEPEVQEDVKWSVPVFSANKKSGLCYVCVQGTHQVQLF